MSNTEFFLNVIIAVVAPELFEIGCLVILKRLNQTQQPKRLVPIDRWPSIFLELKLISNCTTFTYQDPDGASSHYVFLVSLDIRHNTTFCIKDVKTEFGYGPGIMNFISGKVRLNY